MPHQGCEHGNRIRLIVAPMPFSLGERRSQTDAQLSKYPRNVSFFAILQALASLVCAWERAGYSQSHTDTPEIDMKRFLFAAALTLAGLAALPAHAGPQVDFQIVIGNAPPPPRYEVIPVARPGHVWVPGYWAWSGHRHTWVAGHWQRVRAGHHYRAPQWRRVHNGWHFDRGGWERNRHHGRAHPGHAQRRDDRHHRSRPHHDGRPGGPRHH